MYVTCRVISPQLQHINVLCHAKKEASQGMRRGSATADDQFAYFLPWFSRIVYRYEWSTEKWEKLPQSPHWNSGLVIVNGELTAVGGQDKSLFINRFFTLRQGLWFVLYPRMNIARSSPAVVSTPDGNYILVIGGKVGVDSWTTAVELLDVRNRRWYRNTNLPEGLIQPSAVICGSPIHVHVIGLDGDGYSCSLQALLSSDQPITSNILTWAPLPQQPVTLSTAATLSGKLIIVGGQQGRSQVNSIYQLKDGEWVKIGSMSRARSKCLVVTPSPDKMMIVGGYGGGKSIEECVL